ncbi:MAG: TonB-dependent receptor [Alistipes sp.]|nr:TonB-dependent receptor [Bacteroidales bacterium]MCI6165991.1 TonB-dependent receptor [Alistipes sp.]MDY3835546.1 TonB-dependent receptor [Candidatus Cryptobacteroides sp.]CDD15800.1 putative outer membrane protein [Alistipes sp. CAG:435]MCI6440475.1 TonB-dependent receptor [Alistipes sp.]
MSFKKIAMTLALILSTVAAVAQTKTVKGVIYEEETGEPMPGATVSVEGSTRGVMTDLDGSFELTGVKPTDKLKFECLGKETQVLQVGTMTNFVVKLKNAANELDEVTVVAFGKQRKESVIGSISTVDVKTLKVPSSNLTTALAGNVAGVIAYQRTGEPGQDNADFFVRGITTFGANTSPLILIDNIELTSTDLARLQPDDIESFSIMKDATATALYGARGANGVIFVTTKRGQEGPAKIFARVETSISAPTDVVELADPVTYMKSYNEAISTRDPLGELMYTYDKIEQTGKPGANRLIYPANDWYDMLFKDFATSYRANVSARGGGKVATYYVSGAYTEDTGVLKVDKRNSFNNNIDDKNYTLRSNVDINVTPTTKLAVRLTGNFRDYQGPLNGGSDVYRQVMHSDPVLFPAYYPVDDEHVGIQHIMFGNYEDGSYINPYANLVKGYKNYQRSQMIAAVQLEQDLKFITKGLSFMTLFNLTRLSEFTVNRQFNPYWYRLDRYDSYTGEYHVNRINENGTDYLTYSESGKTVKNTMYSETRLNYNRSFGKHDVTGLLVFTASESLTANAGSLQLSLPSRNAGLSGRFTYGYDKRYFVEYNFGYNGSERFHKSHRWGFFPSAGLAWMMSNEKWFKPLTKVVSNLKLRYSYGLVGNDNIGSSSNRFYYLSEMSMNNSGLGATFGETRNVSYNGIGVVRYANEAITWEKSYKSNYALELGLFKKLDIIAEYFTEHRTDIFMQRADIPNTMGLQAAVYGNIGQARSKGIDIQADYKQAWASGLWASARANFTYSTGKYDVYEEPTYPESYRQHAGRSIRQTWGYIAERLFVDDEDAANSPSQAAFGSQYGGGDIKYTDVNGDGVITNADMVPIGYPTSPEIIYGFGVSLGHKGFDFSVFFQGLGRESFWIDATSAYSTKYNKYGTAPFVNNGQLLKAYSDSHWSEDNRDIYALYPRYSAYENHNNTQVSTWWMRDGSFVRLKQMEFGYTLPQKLTNKIHIDNLRVYFQGNNLLCWSKFKLWDPELAGEGFNYPIQRTFNIGVNVTFK